MTTIWEFNRTLTRRLLRWALFSMGSGAALLLQKGEYGKGVGIQFVGWGVVDALIALFGGWSTERQYSQLENPNAPAQQAPQARSLQRLLWINAVLDVFYVLGGFVVARIRGAGDERWRGQGHGIMVQGAFLLVFDVLHALLIPRPKG